MDLRPTDVKLPKPRVDSDHGFGPNSDLRYAEAAMTAHAQQGRPTASRSKKPGTDLLLIVACFCLSLSLLLNVELLIMRAANHPPATQAAVDIASAAAQVDLHDLAYAEAAYRAASPIYTSDSATLRTTGYQPIAGTNVTLYAGSNGAVSFCAVAGSTGGSRWFLYDSGHDGLIDRTYTTEPQAQLGCSALTTLTFAVVT